MKKKVFIIGFHKTGTTTLDMALQRLGYRVYGVDKNLLKFNNKSEFNNYVKGSLSNYDAVQDMPWPLYFKELYELYPDANFILSYRAPEVWIKSVVNFFGSIRIPFHQRIYKVPCAEGYENQYLKLYNSHNQEVIAFFYEKPNFLVMEPNKNFNFKSLCEFLKISEIPKEPFPHGRNNKIRLLPRFKWYRQLRSLYWNWKKNY